MIAKNDVVIITFMIIILLSLTYVIYNLMFLSNEIQHYIINIIAIISLIYNLSIFSASYIFNEKRWP